MDDKAQHKIKSPLATRILHKLLLRVSLKNSVLLILGNFTINYIILDQDNISH